MKKLAKLFLVAALALTLTSCGETSSTHDWALLDLGDEFAVVYDGRVLDYRLEMTDLTQVISPLRLFENGERACVVYSDKFAICTPEKAEYYDGWCQTYSLDGKSFIEWTTSNEPREGETMIDYYDVMTLVSDGRKTDMTGCEEISISPHGELISWTEPYENSRKIYIARTDDLVPLVEVEYNGFVYALPDSGDYALVHEIETGALARVDIPTGEVTELGCKLGLPAQAQNLAATELIAYSENKTCFIKDGVSYYPNADDGVDGIYPITPSFANSMLKLYRIETLVGGLFGSGNEDVTFDLWQLLEKDGGYEFSHLAENVSSLRQIELSDGYWYCSLGTTDDVCSLYRLSKSGGELEKLASDVNVYFPINGGVYYLTTGGEIYYLANGKSSATLISGDANPCGVLGETMIFTKGDQPGKVFSSKKGGEKLVYSGGEPIVEVHETFAVITEMGDQPEYFISKDGKKFNQFFY